MYILKIFVMVCPCIVSNAFSFRFSMNIYVVNIFAEL